MHSGKGRGSASLRHLAAFPISLRQCLEWLPLFPQAPMPWAWLSADAHGAWRWHTPCGSPEGTAIVAALVPFPGGWALRAGHWLPSFRSYPTRCSRTVISTRHGDVDGHTISALPLELPALDTPQVACLRVHWVRREGVEPSTKARNQKGQLPPPLSIVNKSTLQSAQEYR